MTDDKIEQVNPEAAWAEMLWHSYLTGDLSQLGNKVKVVRQIFKHLPTEPRCQVCSAPFQGFGGAVVGVIGFAPGDPASIPAFATAAKKWSRSTRSELMEVCVIHV